MRWVFVAIAVVFCACLVGCGSYETVAQVEASPPSRVYFSGESPSDALSTLSIMGRPEVFDQNARRLVLSSFHPLFGDRITMVVVRAEPMDEGSELRVWARGIRPIGGDWSDRLWDEYSKQLDAKGIPHHVIQSKPYSSR